MKFAKSVFLLAGFYGLLVTIPLFFTEMQTAPLGLNYPEFYYGFAGVTLAWQLLFILLSRDPLRFRPLIPAAILEKLIFAVGIFVLSSQRQIGSRILTAALIDGGIGLLFTAAYLRMRDATAKS